MRWRVAQWLAVLGAPIMMVEDGSGLQVSVGRFDYPDGRRKTRIEAMHPSVFKAAAEATRINDFIRPKLAQLAGTSSSSIERTKTGSVILDINGPDGVTVVLPYFGDDIVRAWTEHQPS